MSDLIPPGRLTGIVKDDISNLASYAHQIYVTLQQSADGVDGSVDGIRKRLSALETKVTALETENASQKAKLDAIAAIEILDFAVTDPVAGPEGDALKAAINQILAGARTENSNGSS